MTLPEVGALTLTWHYHQLAFRVFTIGVHTALDVLTVLAVIWWCM